MLDVFRDNILAGKNVFVAGGTSGINLAIAERFAGQSAKVFLSSRSPDKVKAAVDAIASAGGEADGTAADVRVYDDVQKALEQCHQHFGEIDVVISGAAGNFVAPAIGMSSNGFKTVVDIDLVGTFNVLRAAYPFLRKPGATAISISATQAFTPIAQQAHVCAAKAGIDMLTKVLAMEWGPEGIRVNSIAPGPVEGTEGMARLTPTGDSKQALTDSIPLRRYAQKHEIANVALFLASNAASNMTGTVIVCDGGQSLSSSGTLNPG